MRQCLTRWVSEGLVVENFEKAYQQLLAINSKCLKSRDALVQFLAEMRGAPELIRSAMKEMTGPLPEGFKVATTPNAKEILNYLAKSHTLALVTGGHPPFQLEKLEKAGIDRAIFSNIAIPEDSIKKPFYEGLLREFSLPASQAMVCGDRIAMDLTPAFELGLQTVHMRWGRGSLVETERWIHHAISDLSELKRIVKT